VFSEKMVPKENPRKNDAQSNAKRERERKRDVATSWVASTVK
jgi:hypothetical protein